MQARAPIRLPGRKWFIGTAVIGLIFLAYLWAGYVLAPRLIRSEAARWAGRHSGLSLGLGPIEVDPIHFTVSVRDIRLSDHGQPLASLGRLFIGISPLSPLESSYHITALDLDHPAVHVVIDPDGKLNLAALLAPSGHSTSPTPVFRIDDLQINQGKLSLTDLGRSPAARTTLAPITLRLVKFRTQGRPGGRFVLEAQSDGAILAWQGQVSMSPFASHGTVSVSGLEAGTLAQFLPSGLPMTLSAGEMSLSTQYAVAYRARGLATHLSALDVAATGLGLRGRDLRGTLRIARIEASSGELRYASGRPASGSLPALTLRGVTLTGTGPAAGQTVRLARLALKGASLDEGQRRLAVSFLALAGLKVSVRRSKRGRISLMRLLPSPTPRQVPSVCGTARSHRAGWQIELDHFALTNAVATIEDQTVFPAVRLAITLHSLTAASLSNDLGRAVPFSVRASVGRAYLALNGRVTPASRNAALWVSLAPLSLRTFAPYLPLAPLVKLHSGELGVHAFAELAAGRLVRLSGRMDARDVQLLDRAANTGLFGWHDLTLTGVEYRPAHLVIGLARLTAPTGLIEILPNRTLNLAALASPGTHASAPPAPTSPAHAAPSSKGAPRFAALLRRLDIENGTITFADESIKPHFRAPIDDLHGTIDDISTSRTAIAHIDLAGQVIDRYSPVSVKGTFNPYGLGRSTDIHVAFDNIQLPIFDPYSDFYAGYAIAKGTLSTRFHYRIVNRELRADHHIVVDQLQWGGPSGSKHRVAWPIRLATALLKNRAGVIRIDLPVSGSLNDPSFDIWPVVWMMLRHLLEKAALAPFDLIGKLFAGAQQARYIVFAPGSAALTHGAGASLCALARALAERPALQVDVPAGAAGPEDALALEDERIDALALARLHRAPADGIGALSLKEQRRLLAALYRAKLDKRPVYPAHLPSAPAAAAAPKAGGPHPAARTARHERQQAEIRWLREQLRATVRPSSEALIALGLARARRVQDALLAHGILSANRVFLTSEASGAAWHGRIRLKLQLH